MIFTVKVQHFGIDLHYRNEAAARTTGKSFVVSECIVSGFLKIYSRAIKNTVAGLLGLIVRLQKQKTMMLLVLISNNIKSNRAIRGSNNTQMLTHNEKFLRNSKEL
jgi:hypothetical protein